jgi:hypothetical protein
MDKQEELFQKDVYKLANVPIETLVLLPIAKELCPKMADKLAYYKNMHYALQGTILAEIHVMKRNEKAMLKHIRHLEKLLEIPFQDQWKGGQKS